jgi:type I restriction enzyme S subunit
MYNIMSEIIISVPRSLEEQQRISELLSSIDNLITLHQRKPVKLQSTRKTLLKKMFA